jgi:DNA-binding Xre family transcriptional regulator
MNKYVSLIAKGLKFQYPDIAIELDAPSKKDGSWFIDIRHDDKFVSVEFRPGVGFGITANKELAYGEKSDIVTEDPHDALRKITYFLLSGFASYPLSSLKLRELRLSRDFSQERLAEELNIKQSAISKLERRKDVKVNTLNDVVHAMGGRLRIMAEFSDGTTDIEFDHLGENYSKKVRGPQ